MKIGAENERKNHKIYYFYIPNEINANSAYIINRDNKDLYTLLDNYSFKKEYFGNIVVFYN